MSIPKPDLHAVNVERARAPRAGFRLKRLELFNWGTFHKKVAVLEPDCGWTLVVGENGSGKSTAVDALRTLLVPTRLLNFNDASGDQKKRDQELELTIDSIAYGGNGVARLDGFVVFVRRGLPGDTVRARVTKVQRRHAEALATEVVTPGPQRVDAPCTH